jgi:hypothetical protein
VCLPEGFRMTDRSLIYHAATRVWKVVLILVNRAHQTKAVAEQTAADRQHVGLTKRLAHVYSNSPNTAKIQFEIHYSLQMYLFK